MLRRKERAKATNETHLSLRRHDRREPTDRKAQKKSRSLRNGHKNDQKEQRFADTVQVTGT